MSPKYPTHSLVDHHHDIAARQQHKSKLSQHQLPRHRQPQQQQEQQQLDQPYSFACHPRAAHKHTNPPPDHGRSSNMTSLPPPTAPCRQNPTAQPLSSQAAQQQPSQLSWSSPYLLVPGLHISQTSLREMDAATSSWMMATVIEDDDLTFGGKPLSAWYEEDRRRHSIGAASGSSASSGSEAEEDGEEIRGRRRERGRRRGHGHQK